MGPKKIRHLFSTQFLIICFLKKTSNIYIIDSADSIFFSKESSELKPLETKYVHTLMIFFQIWLKMDLIKVYRFGMSLISLLMYIADVGSDIWVGIDLILRCQYYHGIGVLSLVFLTGFLAGLLSLLNEISEGTLAKEDILKALVYPIWFVPKTLWALLQDMIKLNDDTRNTAKM